MDKCTCGLDGWYNKCAWCNGWMCAHCYFKKHDEVMHPESQIRTPKTEESD